MKIFVDQSDSMINIYEDTARQAFKKVLFLLKKTDRIKVKEINGRKS